MKIVETSLPGICLVEARKFADERGWLAQTWNRASLVDGGIATDWVQENYTHSRFPGTLRGLHFQAPPHAQGKLILVTRGAVYDVAVDIRRGSPNFGRHIGIRLDSAEFVQLWVPGGFAHGYLTLEPDTEVLYHLTAPYAPEAEGGIRWDDPALGIQWPSEPNLINQRDLAWPLLAELDTPFNYRSE